MASSKKKKKKRKKESLKILEENVKTRKTRKSKLQINLMMLLYTIRTFYKDKNLKEKLGHSTNLRIETFISNKLPWTEIGGKVMGGREKMKEKVW